jgi:hypothetical protein
MCDWRYRWWSATPLPEACPLRLREESGKPLIGKPLDIRHSPADLQTAQLIGRFWRTPVRFSITASQQSAAVRFMQIILLTTVRNGR